MLTEALRRAIRELDLAGRHLLIAVSGGVDSMALLDGLFEVREEHKLKLSVGHVHHGLRGPEADGDEAMVLDVAAQLGLEGHTRRVDPDTIRSGLSNRERPTLQEAARQLRYDALGDIVDHCRADRVVTAHNQDDQVETVLMRLFRGTSPAGLGGIPEFSADGLVVRPLLAVPRSAIELYARGRGLQWREDRSNASDDYTRNRIRNHWLPELSDEFNPRLLKAIAGMAESQRLEERWISRLVESAARDQWAVLEGESGGAADRSLQLVAQGWEEIDEALGFRLMALAMREMGSGRDITRVHLARMLAFLRKEGSESGREVQLPGGLRLKRVRRGYLLERARVQDPGPC